MVFETTHKLPFETRQWRSDPVIQEFRIGTCNGQWFTTSTSYCLLSVINNEPGNGHLDDVFQWFENSCRRDNRPLIVLEVINERFRRHLLIKRGFERLTDDHVIKFFERRLKNG
jgi:hypothetical protein